MAVIRKLAIAFVLTSLIGAWAGTPSHLAARSLDGEIPADGTDAPGVSAAPLAPVTDAYRVGTDTASEALSAAAVTSSQVTTGGVPGLMDAQALSEAEAFRTRLKTWADDMLAVYPYLALYADPGTEEVLRGLPEQIDAIPVEQLAALQQNFTDYPTWWDFPDFVRALFAPNQQPMPPSYAALAAGWRQGADANAAATALSLEVTRPQREAVAQRLAELGVPGADVRAAQPASPPAFGNTRPPVPSRSSGTESQNLTGAVRAPVGPLAIQTPDPTPTAPWPIPTEFPPRGDLPPQPDSRPGCPGVFEEQTCDACPRYVPREAVFAADIVKIIAVGIKDAIPAEVDIAIFPGIGITLPNPVKFIVMAISQAAEAASRGMKFNNDLADDCELAYHRALTDLYLDATISSRATQLSLDTQARLDLRLAIERNLLRDADDRISLFQLPQAVCGLPIPDDTATDTRFEGYSFCGQLEYVREIVEDTITKNAAAGMSPDLHNALAELDAGDVHYMISQWKSAYERYSAAYRYAVMQPPVR